MIRAYSAHEGFSVADVSISPCNEQMISCALDGSVVLQSMFERRSQSTNLQEPPLCSAWRPEEKNFEVIPMEFP